MVPALGFGGVLDAVRYLMCFALDLVTPRRLEETVNAEYITSLQWYHTLSAILCNAGEAHGENRASPRVRMSCHGIIGIIAY